MLILLIPWDVNELEKLTPIAADSESNLFLSTFDDGAAFAAVTVVFFVLAAGLVTFLGACANPYEAARQIHKTEAKMVFSNLYILLKDGLKIKFLIINCY